MKRSHNCKNNQLASELSIARLQMISHKYKTALNIKLLKKQYNLKNISLDINRYDPSPLDMITILHH